MTRLLYHVLHKERYASAVSTTIKFVGGGILWIVLSDLMLFVVHPPDGDHFPLFHLEVVKGICFVLIMGGIFLMVLQRYQNSVTQIDQQDFFKKNPNPMLIYCLSSMRFLEVNDAAILAYGYSRKEFLSMSISEIRPPEEVPRMQAAVDQLQNGQRLLGQWKHRRNDGTLLHVEVTACSIVYNHHHAGLIICNDITRQVTIEEELKKTIHFHEKNVRDRTIELSLLNKELIMRNREINANNDDLIELNKLLVDTNKKASFRFNQTLKEKQDQLQRLFNQVNDSVWSIDLTGHGEHYFSKSALSLFGLSEEEMSDRPNYWMGFIHPEDKVMVKLKLNILEHVHLTEFNCRITDQQKRSKPLHMRVNLIHNDEGTPARVEFFATPALAGLKEFIGGVNWNEG